MDRQAWIAISLCVLGLVFWQVYMTSQYAPPPLPKKTEAVATATPTPAPTAAPEAPPPPATEPAEQFAEKTETLRNADVALRLTNRGGGISEAVMLKHAAENGQRVTLNAPDRLPIGAILDKPNAPELREFTIAAQPDGSVELARAQPDGVTIVKRFTLPTPPNAKDNFLVQMQVDFRNDSAQPYTSPGYFVALGSAAPIHAGDMSTYTRLTWCIDGKAKAIDVNWFAEQNSWFGMQKRAAQEFYSERVSGAEWAGVSNQFFATLLTPIGAKATEVSGWRFESRKAETATLYGVEGALGMPGFQLQPGEAVTAKFQIWAGPKLYGRLAKLEHDEAEIMNFGFFKLISQALLNLMNFLHSFVGDYGVAILLLTALVKGVLWPLQNKANRSMRQMSALAPKMQELREKYKDDPTRMNQEVMKLYKQYGINPVGGCLPMMIQIPIFFGLFSMLGQAVELRDARFLWVHDLSQPDTIAHVLGVPINILPLLMGATNVWLMRMTPKTGDTTQQRVMMFMPLIFLFFCYNFAAALALYYTTQNLFTILQLWQNKKLPPPTLEKITPPDKAKKRARR